MGPDVWEGFEFTDLVEHSERYPDGEVVPLPRLTRAQTTVCGVPVPSIPATQPQLGAEYRYPEGGTQRGVAAMRSDVQAGSALQSVRTTVEVCPVRDGSGGRRFPVTWKIRPVKAGDEAVAVSGVAVRSAGGPPSQPYFGREEMLVVRVGRLVWVGRSLDAGPDRKHFSSTLQEGLRGGFTAVEAALRERSR